MRWLLVRSCGFQRRIRVETGGRLVGSGHYRSHMDSSGTHCWHMTFGSPGVQSQSMQRFSVRIETGYLRSGDVEQHPDGHFLFYTDAGNFHGRQWLLIETADTREEAQRRVRERESDLIYWSTRKHRNLRPDNGRCRLCGASRDSCCC